MLGGQTLSRDIVEEVYHEVVTLTNIYYSSQLWKVYISILSKIIFAPIHDLD